MKQKRPYKTYTREFKQEAVRLMIGCLGYLIDSVTHFLFSDFGLTFSEFTFVGELLLPLWLVIKGVDVENWGTLAHSNRHLEYTS